MDGIVVIQVHAFVFKCYFQVIYYYYYYYYYYYLTKHYIHT